MQRRLISWLLVCILVLGSSLPAWAEEDITDVSKDHWAYESVVELVDKGYLSLYEGNKFKGEETVSRYQLAEIVAKLLDRAADEQVALEKEEILTLKKLATEFRSELVEVMSKNDELKQELDETTKQQAIMKEDLVETNDQLNKLRRELNNLVQDLKKEALKVKELKERVAKLEQRNDHLNNRLEKLEDKVNTASTNQEVNSVNQEVDSLKKKFYWVTAGSSILFLFLLVNSGS